MELRDIAEVLEQLLLLFELKGESPFKLRALEQAVRVLHREEQDTDQFIAALRAKKVRGFGPQLTEYVEALYSTGTLPVYEELRQEFPDGIFELFSIPGLGVKKISSLYRQLGIDSIEALERACNEHAISKLKGFGLKSEESICKALAQRAQYRGLLLSHRALALAEELCQYLRGSDACIDAAISGEVRRRAEVVRGLELVAATQKETILREHFLAHALVGEEHRLENGTVIASLNDGTSCMLHCATPSEYQRRLFLTTGAPEHLAQLADRAAERGTPWPPNGDGDEAAIYASLDLAYIEPELREGREEIADAALRHKEQRPAGSLIQLNALRGVLHAHTTYSDGVASLEQLARAVQEQGYEYLGVTDHSRSAGYAGGLSIERVREQHEEIDRLNKLLAPFVIFKGIESDILKDGSLDYPPEVLQQFDFVIASVHARHALTKDAMTERILTAVRNPFTTILGHPSGRLLLKREPYEVDMDQVLESAAKHGVAVEINSNPRRLDLDWRYLRRARTLGIRFPITPDAHSIAELSYLESGIGVARKGGLEPVDVLNTLDGAALRDYFTSRKRSITHA